MSSQYITIALVCFHCLLAGSTPPQHHVTIRFEAYTIIVHISDLLSSVLRKNSDVTFISVFQRQMIPFHLKPNWINCFISSAIQLDLQRKPLNAYLSEKEIVSFSSSSSAPLFGTIIVSTAWEDFFSCMVINCLSIPLTNNPIINQNPTPFTRAPHILNYTLLKTCGYKGASSITGQHRDEADNPLQLKHTHR